MAKIIIGVLLLLLLFVPLFVASVMAYGIVGALIEWGMTIFIAVIFVVGILFIVNGLIDIGKL